MDLKAIIFTLLLISPAVYSNPNDDSRGFYLGGLIGQASYDLPAHKLGANGGDDSETSFKAILGYKYNEYLFFEGGYSNLGDINFSELSNVAIPGSPGVPFDTFENKFDGTIEVDGFIFNAVVSYPLYESFSIYAKAGIFMWDVELDSTLNQISNDPEIPSKSYSSSTSSDGSDMFYGAGISYQWGAISFRTEYELFDADGDNIDVFSIGATFSF